MDSYPYDSNTDSNYASDDRWDSSTASEQGNWGSVESAADAADGDND